MSKVSAQILKLLSDFLPAQLDSWISFLCNGQVSFPRLLPICSRFLCKVTDRVKFIYKLFRNFSGLIEQTDIRRIANGLLCNSRINHHFTMVLRLQVEPTPAGRLFYRYGRRILTTALTGEKYLPMNLFSLSRRGNPWRCRRPLSSRMSLRSHYPA